MAYSRCTHLDVEPDKSGKVIVRKDRAYRCRFPIPHLDEMKLPVSVTRNYGFSWPPAQSFVTKEDCEECPVKDTGK